MSLSIRLARIFDRVIGGLLCILVSLLRIFSKKQKPERILVVKLWAIGESILVLPLLKEIRSKHPKARIDVLAMGNGEVFDGYVNNIRRFSPWTVIKGLRSYDLVYDTEPYSNGSAAIARWMGKYVVGFSHGVRALPYDKKVRYNDQQHISRTYLDLIEAKRTPATLPPLRIRKSDEKKAKSLLPKAKRIIGIGAGVGASCKGRLWPYEKWAELIDRLIIEHDVDAVLVGTKSDEQANSYLMEHVENKERLHNLQDKTNLKEFFALIKQLDLFIGIDSGHMHVAAAMGTPTIGLFGPNTPTRFRPYGKKNTAIYKPVLNQPCINVHKGEVPDCEGHNHMSRITVEDVYNTAKRYLK